MPMTSLMNIVRSQMMAVSLLAAVCASVVLTAPVFAQGTMGAVPDPISSRELEGYGDRLELSRQQRQAMDTLHDQYKQEFQVLRDGDIEKFLSNTRGMGGGMTMLFDREATVKAFKDLEDIHNKVKAIDNRLFDQLQGILTEEQAARLPQVRQARERLRYRSGLSRLTSFMNPAAQVDLGEILVDLTLTPQQKEQLLPVLSQYESSLTSAARKLFDSTSTLVLDGLNKLQEAGITAETMRDREQMGRAFQNLRPIMSEIQLKLAARAAELADLNRRALRSLTPLLTEDQVRSLRDQFYQRAYPEIRTGGGAAARAFEIVLKFNDLSEEQSQTIAAMQTEFRAAFDRLMEQAMDLIDDNRKTQTIFDQDRESRRAQDEKIGEVRERRSQLNESTTTSLKAALTPEMVARLDKRLTGGDEPAEASEVAIVAVTGGGAGGPAAVSVTAARVMTEGGAASAVSIDPFVPGPITPRDLERYAARLSIDPGQQDILNGLHADYIEKYDVIEKDQIASVKQAERSLWGMDAGQVTPPTPAAVDSLYAKRQSALAAIVALDQSFFDDLAIAIGAEDGAEKIQRLREARQRDIYSRAGSQGGGMFFGGPSGGPGGRRGEFRGPGGGGGPEGRAMRVVGGGGSNEAGIDLAALVDSLTLTPTDPTQFSASLTEYERNAVAVFQKLFESSMHMQQARDRMMARATTVDRGGDRQVRIGEDFRTLSENEGRAVSEARRAAATLNKSTLTTLMTALPSGQAQELRRSFNEKAYPDVYRDSGSAQPHLTAALNLPDLSPQQRSQVQEIIVEFNGQYEQLCEKLIELEAAAPDFTAGPPQGGRDGGNFQAIQEQIRSREKVEFERNDLNAKTLARLRGALSEQQVQQLGGLQPTDNG